MHGRPDIMKGHYSAHIFVHFRPKGWPLVNTDRVYGVPPGWDRPTNADEPGWDENGYLREPVTNHDAINDDDDDVSEHEHESEL